jgi:hypothetical protein
VLTKRNKDLIQEIINEIKNRAYLDGKQHEKLEGLTRLTEKRSGEKIV